MSLTAAVADYLAQLQALLPTGAAWSREPGALLTRLLTAVADGLTRVHTRALDLLDEADPRTTYELLEHWERMCGLPDGCTASAANTLAERRAAVVEKLRRRGGQSRAYFLSLAEALGYEIEIEEWRPFIAGQSCCGDLLNGGHDARYSWQTTVLGPRVTLFRCGDSECGDLLGEIDQAADLECLFTRLKPAHSNLIFDYQEA